MKFRCGICGKEYDTIKERAKCEVACAEKEEKLAEEQKKRELELKKQARSKEINIKFNELITLVTDYSKDYGEDPDLNADVNGVSIKFKSASIPSKKKDFGKSTIDDLLFDWLAQF